MMAQILMGIHAKHGWEIRDDSTVIVDKEAILVNVRRCLIASNLSIRAAVWFGALKWNNTAVIVFELVF
jgi:hypothetical protein